MDRDDRPARVAPRVHALESGELVELAVGQGAAIVIKLDELGRPESCVLVFPKGSDATTGRV